MKFKHYFIFPVLALAIGTSQPAKSFSFGADVAMLAQILAKAVMQLEQLRQILQTAKHHKDLLRQVNAGLDRAVRMIQVVDPNFNPGIYRDWKDINVAIREIERLYGTAVDTKDRLVQLNTDRVVAEALANNSHSYKYARDTEKFGEQVHFQSQGANPKSAHRLTAQSLGAVVGQMSQSLRGQATSIKLQAQQLALQNRKDKAQSKQMTLAKDSLSSAFSTYKPRLNTPQL